MQGWLCTVAVYVSNLATELSHIKGRNTEARRRILNLKRFATLEKAEICLKDEEIHPLLRSYYLGFVISAFVDDAIEESGTHIEYIGKAYVSPSMQN